MTFDEVVEHLGGLVEPGKARCPAHPDRSPSLSVKDADGTTLLKCFAGCRTEDVVTAAGLNMGDLFSSNGNGTPPPRSRVVKVYEYVDESGVLLYTVKRWEPGRNGKRKSFSQHPADGRTGAGAMAGVRLVPYRLPELLTADPNATVFIVEGEKDVDALVAVGQVATCGPMGAGEWHRVAGVAVEALRDRYVVVVADKDKAGYTHARDVVASLVGVAGDITVAEAAVGNDIAEHIAAGKKSGDLVILASTDSAATTSIAEWLKVVGDLPPDDETTPRQRLAAVQMSTVTPEKVTWLWPGRLPLGKVVVLDGDPAVGKSTMTTDLAARISTGTPMPDELIPTTPANVVIMSAEDGLADTIRPRLDAAGADPKLIHAVTDVEEVDEHGVIKKRPPSIPDDVALLEDLVRRTGAKLVIVDVLMAYLGGGTNSYRDQDVRLALAPVAAMAERCGCCVVVLRHVRKASTGNALYAGGGSIGIIGAARVGLIAGFDPDDDNPDETLRRRVLAVAKNNLAAKPASLGYAIVSAGAVGRIEWHGPVAHHADDLVDRDNRDDERSDKEDFLRDLLGDGPVLAKDVEKAAHVAGWTIKALRPTLRRLGGRAHPDGFKGPWVWTLDSTDAHTDATDAHIQKRESVATVRESVDDGDVGLTTEDEVLERLVDEFGATLWEEP